jgi:hypothetical protein
MRVQLGRVFILVVPLTYSCQGIQGTPLLLLQTVLDVSKWLARSFIDLHDDPAESV